LPERRNNKLSKIPEPHEIRPYARRGDCVEGETTSVARSEDKGFMAVRRSGGNDRSDAEEDESREEEKVGESGIGRGNCVAMAVVMAR